MAAAGWAARGAEVAAVTATQLLGVGGEARGSRHGVLGSITRPKCFKKSIPRMAMFTWALRNRHENNLSPSWICRLTNPQQLIRRRSAARSVGPNEEAVDVWGMREYVEPVSMRNCVPDNLSVM